MIDSASILLVPSSVRRLPWSDPRGYCTSNFLHLTTCFLIGERVSPPCSSIFVASSQSSSQLSIFIAPFSFIVVNPSSFLPNFLNSRRNLIAAPYRHGASKRALPATLRSTSRIYLLHPKSGGICILSTLSQTYSLGRHIKYSFPPTLSTPLVQHSFIQR